MSTTSLLALLMKWAPIYLSAVICDSSTISFTCSSPTLIDCLGNAFCFISYRTRFEPMKSYASPSRNKNRTLLIAWGGGERLARAWDRMRAVASSVTMEVTVETAPGTIPSNIDLASMRAVTRIREWFFRGLSADSFSAE
uniref:Uncharacterized protein n=1 Tax=Cacopsylla melanoneura TaxID=428564 RepID=A0A8D8VXW6_9HEMI